MRRLWKKRPDIGLERMFETRSEAWSAAGLRLEIDAGQVRRSQRRLALLVLLLVAVVLAHLYVQHHFSLIAHHKRGTPWPADWVVGQPYFTAVAVLAILVIGWLISHDVSRLTPALFKRMDPATAGTVGFLIRLVIVVATALGALGIAGIGFQALAVGGAFTAVVIGLAAQQTLGNVFAGLVLLSARPFRLGERVRLQAGMLGGAVEGVVASQGLLYTALARGGEQIMIPNNVVLAAAVVPLREPEAVDVKVRLSAAVRITHVQDILDANVSVETRSPPSVVLEEIDGDTVVVRIRATPDRRSEGARLADEIIAALSAVTGEHEVAAVGREQRLGDGSDGPRRS